MKIEKASRIGLCFGIKRAIAALEKLVNERGPVETLGPLAHNQQVLDSLAQKGIRTARDPDDIKGQIIVISSHGVSPQVEAGLRGHNLEVFDTTCPFVHRAQLAARRLARDNFKVVVYGEADHAEVKGILGWAEGKGMAVLSEKGLELDRRTGILSQTTQIPAGFNDFVKKVVDAALSRDAELRVIDTICHDTRERQAAALELAGRADLMLIIGSRTSANTNRLAELCARSTETRLIQTAAEIEPDWLKGRRLAGIAAGASTPVELVDEIVQKIEALT